MKSIIKFVSLALASVAAVSCMFSYDNFDEPTATLQGAVTDLDGNALSVGSGDGIRIKLMDYGYSSNPKEQYLKVKMDGTYIHTKIFESTYDIVAEGPFVPLVQVSDEGEIVVDNTQKGVKVKGKTTVNFKVDPFLKVDWTAEPEFNNGLMTVKFKIERGTQDPAWQKDLFAVGLFVCTTQYVGDNNYDKRIFAPLTDTAVISGMIGKENTLTTLDTYPMLPGHTYWIRVGAAMDYVSNFGEGHPYNYSSVKKIVVPEY